MKNWETKIWEIIKRFELKAYRIERTDNERGESLSPNKREIISEIQNLLDKQNKRLNEACEKQIYEDLKLQEQNLYKLEEARRDEALKKQKAEIRFWVKEIFEELLLSFHPDDKGELVKKAKEDILKQLK